ncbi:GIY-YIG nuclease family protein [Paenibacillus spiritus]|uniref:GIY-YIG nuclease family protein n=1 Tax=Paenibacillus spiritus TaxID=2496557 RepID=A0A5J5GIM2_9BACL|nr:GIY-YIG nuclease family protein [Paenibacillus spiritus]KAA9007548.1 GIY-YIG nuclease family protein [Paenibacillus spiritus]
MDKQRRKHLVDEFKEIKTYMGVICLTNKANGKKFLTGFPNLKNRWHTLQMHLNDGRHPNAGLQADWKLTGAEGFTYEVLEQKDTEGVQDIKWEVKQMEKAWLEKLQPYGERGYHRMKEE